MRQGLLRHRVSFKSKATTEDSDGFQVESIVPYKNGKEFWSAVKFTKGNESVESEVIRGRTDIKVKLRYNPEINQEMVLVYKEQGYNILSVLPDEESGNYYMVINAYTGQNLG